MKKAILLAILAISMASCSTLRYHESVYVEDYSKYIEEGFYIYPKNAEHIILDYVPITYIEVNIQAGKPEEGTDISEFMVTGDPHTFADIIKPTPEYLTKRIVEEAKEKGANAIIGFSMGMGTYTYSVSGLAVKLKEKK